MSHFVPRTCTEIDEDGVPIKAKRARSLEDFRESDAYVLLGAPGAGKTMSFRQETECGRGHYVTARDFITFDADDRPEWHEATLFIDGLDEMRAGAADSRTPLDGIRAKLDRLGRPRFRLSCREADWFRANDQKHLRSVSSGGEVKILRLDPLSEDSIRELLGRHSGIEDADQFIASARERGIAGLLANPQSLLMLTQAASGGSWPETRRETFDLACKQLVHEHNQEHDSANLNRDLPSESEALDAAGRLCAVQLLTGSAGYVLLGDGSDSEYLGLRQISDGNRETLRHVLRTKLFESPGESHVAPTHRQIAEFLAGRYLARLIGNGLPVGRVLALMTGEDGGVVSELRGLSAWLAAHDKNSRGEVIDRDPFGTVLYGDVREFSRGEKHRILKCIRRETKKNPWFSNVARMDSRLGDLATNDMKEDFHEILTNPARDGTRQLFVLIVLQSLTHGQVIGALSDLLMRTIRDDSWWLRVRCQALDAFIGYVEQGTGTVDLRVLLEDIHAGSVSDPDDELLGVLLKELYPKVLSASDLLKYLKIPENPSLSGEYVSFWIRHLPESSTNMQLAELLGAITERFDQLSPVLRYTESFNRGKLLARLLARFLETAQRPVFSVVSVEHLFDWLKMVLDETPAHSRRAKTIKSWMSSHPDEYKEMIKIGMGRCLESRNFFHCMYKIERRRFHGVTRPPDFGRWCLEQAISSDNTRIKEYLIHQVADSMYGHLHDEGLSREIVEERLAGDRAILDVFTEKLRNREHSDKQEQEWKQRTEEEYDAGKLQQQQKCRNEMKRHWTALLENKCDPVILHQLAEIYYGIYSHIEGEDDTHKDRLHDVFGGDEDFLEVVLDGLRGSVNRADVPDAETILCLFVKEKQIHFMALPFLIGLEMNEGPADERQVRQALAVYYTRPTGLYDDHPPVWYNSVLATHVLATHADVATEVLIRLIRAEIRSGKEIISGLRGLRDSDEIARVASISLLRTFPARCPTRQLNALGTLLGTALRLCEAALILELTDRKLVSRSMNTGQRVYWLAAGVLASDSAESYREQLREYVSGNERRIRYLTVFMNRLADWIYPEYIRDLDTPALRLLIKLMGSSYGPAILDSRSHLIHKFIDRLVSIPSLAAAEALKSLSSDDALRSWKPYLVGAMDPQNTIRREAGFHHPDVDQVQKTLDGGNPANVADLAALTFDFLTEIARNICDGNTSDWCQYWNWDQKSHRRRLGPIHEDHCRDRLLSDLQYRIGRLGIDAAPEGRYADEKRSDIRLSCSGFNVPVEIKKSNHQNLWSAIRNQLIAKYTRDPGAGGHGIYLVFWFGKDYRQPPPESRSPPGSATELDERLRDTLSPEEARMIRVCVIDVAGAPERKQDVQVGRGRKKGSA